MEYKEEYSTKNDVMTVGELMEYIKDLDPSMGIYFFMHDDSWDSVKSVETACKFDDEIHGMESIDEDDDDKWDGEKPTDPDCIVFWGHHN